MYETSGVCGVQLRAGEVVRRRVAQVDHGVGNDTSDVDESGRARRVADGWHSGSGRQCGVDGLDGDWGRAAGTGGDDERAGNRELKQQLYPRHLNIVAVPHALAG